MTVGKPYFDKDLRKKVLYDIGSGNYGVAVSTGPSYTSQRQEAFSVYSEVAKTDKNFMGVAGDIVFRNMDAPGSEQIAERLEKLLPAEIRPQKAGEEGEPTVPPEMLQKMQMIQEQAGAVIEGLTQKVQELESEISSRTIEAETRERIAMLQEETKRLIAAVNIGQKEAQTLLLSELQSIKHKLDLSDAEKEREHRAKQAEMDRKAAAAQAQQGAQEQPQGPSGQSAASMPGTAAPAAPALPPAASPNGAPLMPPATPAVSAEAPPME